MQTNFFNGFFRMTYFQVVNKKCTEQQTAAMIKFTAVSTDQRKANIQEQVNSIQYNRSDNLAAFGIKVDDQRFVQVPARQLPPPRIEYRNGTMVTPSKGQWRMEFGRTSANFLQPANCLKWCVLNTEKYLSDSDLNTFIGEVGVHNQTFKVIFWGRFLILDFNFAVAPCQPIKRDAIRTSSDGYHLSMSTRSNWPAFESNGQ